VTQRITGLLGMDIQRPMFRRLPFAVAVRVGLLCFILAAMAYAAEVPRRVAVLSVGFEPAGKEAQAFRSGLRDAGYSDGSDLLIEWQSAHGDYTRVPRLAQSLVEHRPDVIVGGSTIATQALQRATSSIPIVMAAVADPIASGLVTNLAHPDGNTTGLAPMTVELSAKRLQLLKDLLPEVTRVGVLGNPDTPYTRKVLEDVRAAAVNLGIEIRFISVRKPEELSQIASVARRMHIRALYVIEDPVYISHRAVILSQISKAQLPAIFGTRSFTESGGLLSFGVDYAEQYRRAAGYVARILKGAKPADLPIEQPTKLELVINLKTAGLLGIEVPESILLRADEIIR